MKKITKLSKMLLSSLTALSILTFTVPSYSSDIEEMEGELNTTSIPSTAQEVSFLPDFKFDPLVEFPVASWKVGFTKVATLEPSENLFVRIVEISKFEREIKFHFSPRLFLPKIEIPSDFPMDVACVLPYMFSEATWKETSLNLKKKKATFGFMEGSLTTGTLQRRFVGHWSAQMCESSDSFRTKLLQRANILQNDGLRQLCAKNPELTRLAGNMLDDMVYVDYESVKIFTMCELAKLIAYTTGGKLTFPRYSMTAFELLPERLQLQHDCRAHLPQFNRAHKKYLVSEMSSLLRSRGYTYDSKSNTLCLRAH